MNSVLDDFKNAWHKPNNGLAQLIIINVAVYVGFWVILTAMLLAGINVNEASNMILDWIAIPASIERFVIRPWTIITYAFMHDSGLFHILFNMLWLYWFGKVFVDFLGSQRLINLYILGALAGGIIYLTFYSLVPLFRNSMDPSSPTIMIGASAAVYAVVAATATYWPNHRFYLIFFGPVKIVYIAVVAIFISYISIIQRDNLGGNIAHLGGALIGYIYAKQLLKGNELGKWVFSSMMFIKSFFVKSPNIKVSHRQKKAKKSSFKSTRSTSSSQTKGDFSQAEIDKILDKISERGYDSLSKEEKEKLFNASKK